MPENKLFLLLYILLNMDLSTVEQMASSAVMLQFMSSTLQSGHHHQPQLMSSLMYNVQSHIKVGFTILGTAESTRSFTVQQGNYHCVFRFYKWVPC